MPASWTTRTGPSIVGRLGVALGALCLRAEVMEANLKLVDFGLSKPILDTKGQNQLKTKAGTPMYMAPEILSGQYDEKVDPGARKQSAMGGGS